ncbi:MAG: NAD-dependent epimerase/dehydratase family protein [Actinobacteria bacterium]|uniref:Unannotated protein n=1 Tax=freshwater metagenome TaxID=449393 RepID=A0A6J7QBC0_9ZZZZ|nr:NAD-dependent epimerase/dehydratase family protein [Actinomycetota bacterium]
MAVSHAGQRDESQQRVLVTGALGFVGSHVVQHLLDLGWAVVGIDNLDDTIRGPADRVDFLNSLDHPRWSFHHNSASAFVGDSAPLQFDAVIHLAASVGLAASWADPSGFHDNNVGETAALVRAVRASPRVRRVVHVSTSSVYGRTAEGAEGQPLTPTSPYGTSKLEAEALWTNDLELSRLTTVLRLFSVFGPRQRPDMLWSRVIDSALRGAPSRIFDDGHQRRTFTYVTDVAAAVCHAADASTPAGVFNIAGAEQVSVLEGVSVLEDILGRPVTVAHEPALAGDQRRTRGDSARAARDLGYAPRLTFRDGLAAQVEYQRARALT